MSNRTILAQAAILVMLASAAPAFAQTRADADAASQSVTVQLGDLNLNSPAGARAASGRIRAAVRAVCGDAYADRSYAERTEVTRCAAAANRSASIKVNQAMLSALIDGGLPRAQLASR